MELALDGLAHDGRGIGRVPAPERPDGRGLTVFVAGGLPGQRVRCRVLRRKPRFLEAELVEVLSPGPEEVPPLCPHSRASGDARGCGGCPLQTMPYDRQLQWKERLARDALTRIGGLASGALDAAWEATLPSPALSGFRNRMTFAFGAGGDSLVLGQRSRGGADVVPTPDCALLPPGGRELLAEAQAAAASSGLPAWRASGRRGGKASGGRGLWRFLTLRQGWLPGEATPRWWALCVTSPGGQPARDAVRTLGERLLGVGGASRLGGFIHEERSYDDALAVGERRVLTLDAQGKENPRGALLRLPLGGRSFALDPESFFQVNTGAAELLVRTVLDMAPASGNGLLDLYCGVGAPGQLVAPRFGAALGLEADSRAILAAWNNAKEAGLDHCRYLGGDAAMLLGLLASGKLTGLGWNKTPHWDTALLDPPRAGLAPAALDALLHIAPDHLVYVSCNPATLARDAARLSAAYTLERLPAVDLFPHTPHLECCSLWRRKLSAERSEPRSVH
ncbi:TRAM domain-containing protein [Desulfovibrio sp.]|uniref:class I SAM-dependent RNA methyltransferase n=1 Tax=Desulfovibrio sp. TaxID=885 RepID=UPI0023BF7311|nr:TRAM domain-containing protein [Desulfovibrio sp.]MDE7241916.1 TRAM domain-containing protein [Desulfovibrio sp.]